MAAAGAAPDSRKTKQMQGAWDEYIGRYLREHRFELRNMLLNLDEYVKKEEYDALLQEKEKADENYGHLTNERDNLKEDKKQLEQDNEFLKNQMADLPEKLDKTEKELNRFENEYGQLDEAYRLYQSLGKYRFQMEGIFGDGGSAASFFCGALQKEHLDAFWDMIMHLINNRQATEDEISTFKALFDFCFDTVNRSGREPIYQRLAPVAGNRFNGETMCRTSSSKQIGYISRVLLPGYEYMRGNVVKPSLVEVENEKGEQ